MVDIFRNEDVFKSIMVDWMTLPDLVRLDTAIVNREKRTDFLALLNRTQYNIPFGDKVELWWKNHKACLKWIVSRKMYAPLGVLNMNQTLWKKLLDDASADYKPFLSSVQKMDFHNAANFNFQGFELCQRLEELKFLHGASNVATDKVICPNLKTLFVQTSTMNEEFFQAFSTVHGLQNVTFFHSDIAEGVTVATLNRFFRNVTSFRILGTSLQFYELLASSPEIQFPALQSLSIDRVLSTEAPVLDYSTIFSKCPALKDIHIERICQLNYVQVIKTLALYCKHLQVLDLNHCKLDDPVASAAAGPDRIATSITNLTSQDDLDTANFTVTSLHLSTMILMNDHHFQNILHLVRHSLREVHIAFCEKLSDSMYTTHLVSVYPHVIRMCIEDKRVNWYEEGTAAGGSNRVATVTAALQSIPSVKIVLWEKWLTEKEKQTGLNILNNLPLTKEIVLERNW